MSHEITNIDRQEGIEMGWHKLTVVKPLIELLSSWLAQWDVSKVPMLEGDGSASEYCRITCTDDPKIRIGAPVHCESYGLVTNADFLRIINTAIREIPGAKVASVGSVCGRSRIFVSVKLEELAEFKAAGRSFVPYLNFLSSHDMSAPFAVNTSNICTVCNNTFGMNLSSLSQRSGMKAAQSASESAKAVRVVMKHTKNVMERLENVPEIVDGFHGAQALFKLEMDKLAAAPIKIDDANALFAGFLTARTEVKEPMSTRRANQVNRLTELFVRGAGNEGQNRADWFSAATDYYSHENAGGDDRMRQFVSSEFGSGQTAKAGAWDLIRDDKAIEATLARGKTVLALS
jgi:hypothetical protein